MCYRQTSGDEENAKRPVQDFSGKKKEEEGRRKNRKKRTKNR